MSIQSIRFAAVDATLKLQVLEHTPPISRHYDAEGTSAWRDAKAEDLLDVARFTYNPEGIKRTVDSLAERLQSLQEQVHNTPAEQQLDPFQGIRS